MRVFVTGASGWVGNPTVSELVKAGHSVHGLARSDKSAAAVEKAGAAAVLGSLDDLDILRAEAEAADGVIHTAFNHDFSKFAENAQQDARVIRAMGEALSGTGKKLVITSGTGLLDAGGGVATEETPARAPSDANPRISESAGFDLLDKGVSVIALRLPPSTHGKGDYGFTPILVSIARQKGYAAFVGEGGNVWAAGHRFDAARLYRLALEKGTAGARYHAAAEEGVAMRDIASAIGKGLGIPVKSISQEEAGEYYGWFAHFAALNARASSARTQEILGWRPTEKTLLEDLAETYYFEG